MTTRKRPVFYRFQLLIITVVLMVISLGIIGKYLYFDVLASDQVNAVLKISSLRSTIIVMILFVLVTILLQRLHMLNQQLFLNSITDELTGLKNRRALLSRKSFLSNYSTTSILHIDLDRFKLINNTFGDRVADEVLVSVSKRLKGCIPEGEGELFRLAGDQFVAVLLNANQLIAEKTGKQILTKLTEPFFIQDRELFISASIGATLYPMDGKDLEDLLKNANAAMYEAKKHRKRYEFYKPEMHVQSSEIMELENDLHKALKRNEFVLHYQPKLNLQTGSVTGVEALLRWEHPRLGDIPPSKFIPLAEESGLIMSIGEWVLKTACKQNKYWQQNGIEPFRIAVNLSARQFEQKDLVERIRQVLKETSLDARWLEIEITESVLMKNKTSTMNVLTQLKELEICITIDDFGTGYSSLSYLKQFTIDNLKIDRSFVEDITTSLDNAAITTAVVTLAKNLQLTVIAEGVETEQQLTFLRSRHCDEAQGYLFSLPLPAEDIELKLRSIRNAAAQLINAETIVKSCKNLF